MHRLMAPARSPVPVARRTPEPTGHPRPPASAAHRALGNDGVQRLLAAAAPPTVVLRQGLGESGFSPSDADVVAEREYGNKPAPKAQNCGRPANCPPGFCEPYRSQPLAEYYRAKKRSFLLMGIAAAVNSRVVPLWREYLDGGSAPKDLSADFGADFTKSPTTARTSAFLRDSLRARLALTPPFVNRNSSRSVDIGTLIPGALAAIGDPASADQMNFNLPKDIPGNLAGGIGTDETACPAGAQPSPFNDERRATGTVGLTRGGGREVTVTPSITYTVRDTIDLCPGDCGRGLEKLATVPLSQFEATGISGDIPFTVNFPGPPLDPFTISAPEGPDVPSSP
jgi:hypothetical protein